MNRTGWYILANVLTTAVVIVGSGSHSTGQHPLYAILLFAICSTPILEKTAVNGPYALLYLFSLDYFLMFGALEIRNYVLGPRDLESSLTAAQSSGGVLSTPETVVLLGGLLVQVSYRAACRAFSKPGPKAPPKDWSERTLVFVGIALWIVCTRLDWNLSVHILADATNAAVKRGFGNLGGVQLGIYMLARMAQPLSILILAYAQCRYKRPVMAPLVLVVVIFQLIFGFIIDFKTEALIGGVLVVLTNLLVNGRVPKAWVALMLVVVAVGFPLLQANRVVRNQHAATHSDVAENLSNAFSEALHAEDKVNSGKERAQTALERLTLKGSVEVIVKGTAADVPLQHGYTLLPMLTAFIPRLLYPDKPNIPTGQIMSRQFHLSDSEDTYSSPSHLGELYWNFGWSGVVVGMTLVGLILGTIGAKFNLAEAATVTRVLVIVVTIRQVILASEGEIATQYVVWMRSLFAIGLLHWAFARVPWVSRSAGTMAVVGAEKPALRALYPNLLR
jgi:hypothetical protein